MLVQSTVFEKINVFLVNTVLGQVSLIANNMFFLKHQQLFIGKIAWFHCSSVFYIGLKHFYVSLIDCFSENQCFFSKHCFRPSQCDCKQHAFSEKLAVIHWKNCLVSLQFSVLHWFKAFLCEFNRLFLRKSMFFQ